MTRLRQATLALDPAWRAIRADRDRIARIVATHPYPDPCDRDPAARGDALAARLADAARARHDAAQAAQDQAAAAMEERSRWTRALAWGGWLTAAQCEAVRLAQAAQALADTARWQQPTAEDMRDARADGAARAYAAQQTTRDWEARPYVAAAIEAHRLNQAVDAAMAMGDPAISKAMTAGDPEAARSIIRAREQANERRAAEQERLADLARGPHGHDGAKPPKPGRK